MHLPGTARDIHKIRYLIRLPGSPSASSWLSSRNKDVDYTITTGEFHLTQVGIQWQGQPLSEAAELHEHWSKCAAGCQLLTSLTADDEAATLHADVDIRCSANWDVEPDTVTGGPLSLFNVKGSRQGRSALPSL